MYAAHLYILHALLRRELGARSRPAPGDAMLPSPNPDCAEPERAATERSTALRPPNVNRPARAPA